MARHARQTMITKNRRQKHWTLTRENGYQKQQTDNRRKTAETLNGFVLITKNKWQKHQTLTKENGWQKHWTETCWTETLRAEWWPSSICTSPLELVVLTSFLDNRSRKSVTTRHSLAACKGRQHIKLLSEPVVTKHVFGIQHQVQITSWRSQRPQRMLRLSVVCVLDHAGHQSPDIWFQRWPDQSLTFGSLRKLWRRTSSRSRLLVS